VVSVEEINKAINDRNVPSFEAVAPEGVGVFETLKAIAKLVLIELRKGAGS
jgi:hypothetical protein